MAGKRGTPKTEDIKEALRTKTERRPVVPESDRLSLGCSTINLAITGSPEFGIGKGHYLWFVGDSSSGKTWIGFTAFAEAALNKNFSNYRFVHDNAENGALMDVEKYFGSKVLDRLLPPAGNRKKPKYSRTVQEFYYHLDSALDEGPCIYLLDSMDALNADEDEEIFEQERKVYEEGKGQVSGSMGMHKAKYNSRHINRAVGRLSENGSILIVINQTRDKIGGLIPGQKTYAGGRALRFYAHVQLWTSVRGPIKKTYLGAEREIGSLLQIDVQKNRISGWEGKINVPFYRSLGIDDTGACVQYLVDESHWKEVKEKGKQPTISAPEFDYTGTREGLIQTIEKDEGDLRQLKQITASLWTEIDAGAAPVRRPRY